MIPQIIANQARDILKNENDENKAWELAQKDETLNAGVTKEQWLAWAYKANADEEERRKIDEDFYLNHWD